MELKGSPQVFLFLILQIGGQDLFALIKLPSESHSWYEKSASSKKAESEMVSQSNLQKHRGLLLPLLGFKFSVGRKTFYYDKITMTFIFNLLGN